MSKNNYRQPFLVKPRSFLKLNMQAIQPTCSSVRDSRGYIGLHWKTTDTVNTNTLLSATGKTQ